VQLCRHAVAKPVGVRILFPDSMKTGKILLKAARATINLTSTRVFKHSSGLPEEVLCPQEGKSKRYPLEIKNFSPVKITQSENLVPNSGRQHSCKSDQWRVRHIVRNML
jgi:hypothetical protein